MDNELSETEPRFAIGIDLGTTNCALAFVDRLKSGTASSEILPIPQYDSAGVLGSHATLPSFLYFLIPGEEHSFEAPRARPWQITTGTPVEQVISGRHARTRAGEVPGRVIVSAKSWLGGSEASALSSEIHGFDADQPILPWGSSDLQSAQKLSPVDAAAHYLLHLKSSWDQQKAQFEPAYLMELQDVVITVPASFDEVAQRLTLEAARRAGLGSRVRLLEEPQAAFYRYLESQRERGGRQDSPSLDSLLSNKSSARLLVCDMGGGTTDFSVFDVRKGQEIERVAVSEHLLLGGDNLDLALARALEAKMLEPPQRLSTGQWGFLVQATRALKEEVFAEGREERSDQQREERFRVAVPPEGGNLFAGSLSAEITCGEISELVLRGFFPDCSAEDMPMRRRQGLRELGLPYAPDTAVTKHLAAFLRSHRTSSEPHIIDAVLFVGGSFIPTPFRTAVLENLERWQGKPPRELAQTEFDLGVARGAAMFASLARKDTRRIRAGYAHSVYLEVRTTKSLDAGQDHTLLCILPQGAEPGSSYRVTLPHLKVVLGQPVRFQAFTCLTHPEDRPGEIRTGSDDHFHQLAPLQTTVTLAPSAARPAERGEKIGVVLEAEINDLGMLQVFLLPAEGGNDAERERFELQFNLRPGALGQTDLDEPQTEAQPTDLGFDLNSITALINRYFGKKIPEGALGADLNPAKLVRELELELGSPRSEWTLPQLRAMWKPLGAGMSRRSRSLAHEMAWLSLAGFVLRPGYGAPLDAVRVQEAWKAFEQGMFFGKEARVRLQWWIMWRRVAGGLSADKHELLFHSIQSTLQPRTFENSENILLAGSLERVRAERKREFGNVLIKRLKESKSGQDNLLWALSRVGARILLAAGPEFVVPPSDAETWLEELMAIDWKQPQLDRVFACIVQLGRLTGERALDISTESRSAALVWLRKRNVNDTVIAPLREFVPLDATERRARFGEVLPSGLELG